ncbi:hypothetical protein VI817_008699 [Penicillium citrinum]|nr:hypothetical protein VI817_008699 [Penicillium citrinum]
MSHLLLLGDDYKQLPNVRAIIEAYRMGELDFSSTLVTYWSNGEKISEPGKFQLKHFLSVNKRYNGHEGFWVEGGQQVGSNYLRICMGIPSSMKGALHHYFDIAIRPPGAQIHRTYEFMDDTGSSFLNVLQADVDLLHLLNPSHQGVGLGFQRMELAVGHVNCASVLMEAAIFSKNGEILVDWTAIQAVILPAHLGAQAEHRSSGQWCRKIVASVTVPDKLNRMFICSERSDLNDTAKIPDFGPQDEVPQNIMYRPPAWGPGFFPLPPPLSYTTNRSITRPNKPPPGPRNILTQTDPPELGLSDMVGVFTKPVPAKPKSPAVSFVSAVSGTPVVPVTTGTGTPVTPTITITGTGTPTNPGSTGLGVSTSPVAPGTGSAIGTGTSISSDTTGGGVSIGTGHSIGTGGSISPVNPSIADSASPVAPGTGIAPGTYTQP